MDQVPGDLSKLLQESEKKPRSSALLLSRAGSNNVENYDCLTDYQQFIQQLQQKYSTLADPTTVLQSIEVEAKLLEAQDHHRWQNF